MDLKFIFRRISQKLMEDFSISSQISHSGVKGDFRESYLRNFLEDGKLPQNYGIGSGLIVSPLSQESNQSDLIIFDRNKCPAWMFSERVQVFPIEGIYGIIEVKSSLSKCDLYDGLAKIERLRSIVPKNAVSLPFGIIFGYSLKGNSLESLQKNLREYQIEKQPLFWPNLVVVLEEGVIFQYGRGLKRILKVENFEQSIPPGGIGFKKDTLFEFYSALFSILSNTHLGDIDISSYRELPSRVGNHFVRNHVFEQRGDKIYAFSEKFINKIFTYCQNHRKKTLEEILLLSGGAIQYGYWAEEQLLSENYYYDPDNLPGIHLIDEPYKINEYGRPVSTQRMKVPFTYVEIDSDIYYFPMAYVRDNEADNLMEVTGKELENLNF